MQIMARISFSENHLPISSHTYRGKTLVTVPI